MLSWFFCVFDIRRFSFRSVFRPFMMSFHLYGNLKVVLLVFFSFKGIDSLILRLNTLYLCSLGNLIDKKNQIDLFVLCSFGYITRFE